MSEVKMPEDIQPIAKNPGRAARDASARNALLCALAVVCAVLVADPTANMPFSDGFSYDKTALDFARTGHLIYNGWATAMLGWLVPWGALFIKTFGFSFTAMRLSMLPIDVMTVYLFHQILRRFGLNSQNAVFGTIALSLSPLFLPCAASFMTDIPGLLVIFLCMYMCLRAVQTTSPRASLLWLCSATAVNVAGGTVRQIAWLGALVMVPSTAWLLRERRFVKLAACLLWVFTLAGVLGCLHWFNTQPYSVPEHIIWAPLTWMTLPHLAAQFAKTLACIALVIFPVSVAWLPTAGQLSRKARLRIVAVLCLVILLWIIAFAKGRIDTWLMPWLMFLLAEQSSLVPGMFGTPDALVVWLRIILSLVVIATALIMLEQLPRMQIFAATGVGGTKVSWRTAAWILGPFTVSYLLLLAPRGAFDQIQDRYLIGLTPILIIVLLRLYQETVGSRMPAVSVAALALFAIYSIAGTHDFFAESRAQLRALRMLKRSGVPRLSIETGFPDDGWVQIQNGGHINEPRIQVPAGAYVRNPAGSNFIPPDCMNGFTKFAPIIVPKYFVTFPWFKNPPYPPPKWCYVPSSFPPIRYTTWLPPFREKLYVEQLTTRRY